MRREELIEDLKGQLRAAFGSGFEQEQSIIEQIIEIGRREGPPNIEPEFLTKLAICHCRYRRHQGLRDAIDRLFLSNAPEADKPYLYIAKEVYTAFESDSLCHMLTRLSRLSLQSGKIVSVAKDLVHTTCFELFLEATSGNETERVTEYVKLASQEILQVPTFDRYFIDALTLGRCENPTSEVFRLALKTMLVLLEFQSDTVKEEYAGKIASLMLTGPKT